MIKQIVWSSMIDWPNENCAVLFLEGCNFCCSYCHNKNLSNEKTLNFDNILIRLNERKSFIDHVVLSGGEPTMSKEFKDIVNRLYDNGFKVGIHTNGSCFECFEGMAHKISFIGLDIKNTFGKYTWYMNDYDLGRLHHAGITKSECCISSIKKYLSHIQEFQYEIRTVLNMYVTEFDLIQIATLLKSYNIDNWVLQHEFQNNQRIKHQADDWYVNVLEKLNKIIKVDIR
jgi:pyruvate formate lyase activating enzyme